MNVFDYPASYFLALALLIALVAESSLRLRMPWTRPAIAVYLTTAAWYLMDMAYNGVDGFNRTFPPDIVSDALIQVCGFLLVFRVTVVTFTRWMTRDLSGTNKTQINLSNPLERQTCAGLLFFWMILTIYAILRVDFDLASVFFPPLSDEPKFVWARGAVGGGLDFLVSVGEYTHMVVVGLLGAFAVIARQGWVRTLASAAFVLGLQAYLFQNARNRILVVIMPAIMTYLLAGRASILTKCISIAFLFIVISLWFLIIVNNRSRVNMASMMITNDGIATIEKDDSKHYGLDMLMELCYADLFIETDHFPASWGMNYVSHFALVIPRSLWPNKPFAGIDYAVARGMSGGKEDTGVFVTIAGGMIGQGVQNFGRYFGPPVAALLLAGWVALLGRLWVQRQRLQRFGLFVLGMGLTFNLGRDITLLVLFPFLFCYLSVIVYEWTIE